MECRITAVEIPQTYTYSEVRYFLDYVNGNNIGSYKTREEAERKAREAGLCIVKEKETEHGI